MAEKEKINKEEPKKTEIKKETKAEEKQRLENIKAYKILSYIGILWLIGLLVPENEDKKLKFHVGQGIILSIFQLLLSFFVRIVNTMFVGMIFREEVYYYTQPTGIYTISFFGSVIMAILNLSMVVIIIYLIVIGISNAINDRQKELPIIGKYSFYK